MNPDRLLKIRGCLLTIGIGLMVIGGHVVFNRSLGTENFVNTGLDLKNIAIFSFICGYIVVTAFTTRLRMLAVCGMAAVGLAMFIGSFGGGSMGSWGWVVNMVAVLAIAPLAAIVCVIAGAASLVKIISECKTAQRPILITGAAIIAVFLVLLFLINYRPGLNAAVASLYSKDQHERIAAAKTLADIYDKRAINPLIEMLSDPDAAIRASAAETLGSFVLAGMNSDTRSIKPLINALGDKSANVRAAAALSLGRITEHLDSEAAQWPVEPLKTALKDADPSVRAAAQKALAMIE